MNIENYEIENAPTRVELAVIVRQGIKNGWTPLGSPFISNAVWYQAVVKYEERET